MKLSKTRDQLIVYFNKTELRNLCFDLGIDHEEIPGQTKGDMARELVAYCARRGLTEQLIKRCQELRPHVSWENNK